MLQTIKRYRFNKIFVRDALSSRLNIIFKNKIEPKYHQPIISKIDKLIFEHISPLKISPIKSDELIVKIVSWYFTIFGIITVSVCILAEMGDKSPVSDR